MAGPPAARGEPPSRYTSAVARIKADVRREEILRATCREVIARGFASTRVGDVAAALGVSTGLVFYHFTNKET
ncbi:MAG TPA: helix-turn-helix domain-containing protein, partial [Actinomycetota bacterium]|nr:helix-turn-helix domain-containing protein [Actinomycetota bacterium]